MAIKFEIFHYLFRITFAQSDRVSRPVLLMIKSLNHSKWGSRLKTRRYSSNQQSPQRSKTIPVSYGISPPLPLFLHYQYKPLHHQAIPVKGGSAGSASTQPKRWFLSGVLFSLSGRWSLLRGGSARISLSELDTGLLDPTRKKITKLRSDIIGRRRKQKQRSRSHGGISPLFTDARRTVVFPRRSIPLTWAIPLLSLVPGSTRKLFPFYQIQYYYNYNYHYYYYHNSFILFYFLLKIIKKNQYQSYLFYFTSFYISSWVADTLVLFYCTSFYLFFFFIYFTFFFFL